MEDSSRDKDRPEVLPLKRIEDETPEIKTFYVESPDTVSSPDPGQFLMLWIIGTDEIPISVSSFSEDGTIGLTVERVGDATSKLHELRSGDLVGIRGPYGNGFDLSGENILMVCGGCGAAPLAFSADRALKQIKNVTVILAAKTKSELLFRDRLEDSGVDLVVATEDGSAGIMGLATDALEEANLDWDFDSCLLCGPEMMMSAAADFVKEKNIPIQLSLDRYMKCGVGLCGQCSLDPSGLRVCHEGPVFRYKDIEDSEFGEYRRNSSGEKVKL